MESPASIDKLRCNHEYQNNSPEVRYKEQLVYLAKLNISNFRKLQKAELSFQPGLNVLVGANIVGKTAVVDALRALLAGHDEPYPRLDIDDVHHPKGGKPAGDIVFRVRLPRARPGR
jgi:putative ATP-dependent endonuclease of OLD family